MPNLFSYGTLQNENVQIETYGRKLNGERDILTCYTLDFIEITDPEVLRKSSQKFHPIIQYSGIETDQVEGVLFKISDEELIKTDAYEVDDYIREEKTFASGKNGWVYIQKAK